MGRLILSCEVDAVMYRKSYLQSHLSLSTQLSFSLERETASLPGQYFPSSKSRLALFCLSVWSVAGDHGGKRAWCGNATDRIDSTSTLQIH